MDINNKVIVTVEVSHNDTGNPLFRYDQTFIRTSVDNLELSRVELDWQDTTTH